MKPYYERNGITIYHGDCREVLPTLEKVDHVITDPPYSETTHSGARTWSQSFGDYPPGEFIDFASMGVADISRVFALANPTRWTIATMDWRHVHELEETPPQGLRFVRAGVWVKPDGAPQFTGDRPATGWEMVAILHRSDVKMKWNGGGHHAVWTHNKCNSGHPTGKPLGLVSRWVQLFSDPGELILDPFMGSGTTLRAAMDLGRRAIGIELEEKYCEVAAKRLAQEVLL